MTIKVNIAAVQFKWKLEDYKDRESFINRIDSIVKDIRQHVDSNLPVLIVFPEDIGTPIVLFNHYEKFKNKIHFSEVVRFLILLNIKKILMIKLKHKVSFIRALFLLKGINMEEEYCSIFSNMAKKYSTYIAAGSITLPDITLKNNIRTAAGNDVYNISYFFGPDGNIIGKQKKVHLVDFEGKSGFDLSEGGLDEIKVFDTPFGKVGIAICLDAFKEDVINSLSKQGADILVQPSANNGVWNEWQQKDWLNGSYLSTFIRKKFKYAINPMMNGKLFDLSFEGQSSIISGPATNIKTGFKNLESIEGFINVAKGHNEEEILIHKIEI